MPHPFSITEFEQHLLIDKHHLDEAISHQSSLLYQVSSELALSLSVRDELKQHVDEAYAFISLGLRDEAAKSGTKITEDFIKQSVMTESTYTDVVKDYLSQKGYCDRVQALKDAFVARGYMIREMAGLWVAGYYADSAITTDSTTAQNARYEVARAAIAERRQLKRRPLAGESDG